MELDQIRELILLNKFDDALQEVEKLPLQNAPLKEVYKARIFRLQSNFEKSFEIFQKLENKNQNDQSPIIRLAIIIEKSPFLSGPATRGGL